MPDIKTPWLIWLKACLLLVVGIVSGALLLADLPSWRHLALLCCCVWGFCRTYYFAFHVIEHWLDASYRFTGLIDFVGYVLRRYRRPPPR